MKVYPIYLNRLDSHKTVLVGGDEEAERKAGELLECDANITLIAPEVTDKLEKMIRENDRLEWIQRRYQPGDLRGAFIAIVAEFEDDENKRIFEEAEQEGVLINVMDDIPHCKFTFGSMVKRGALTLSFSTSGTAPTLAVRLRERFEKEFGKEYEPFLEFMSQLRPPMAEHYPDFERRKSLWYRLIDSNVLPLFRSEDIEGALEETSRVVGEDVVRQTRLYSEIYRTPVSPMKRVVTFAASGIRFARTWLRGSKRTSRQG